MLTPSRRRQLIILLIVVIMVCCTASAYLGLRSGHYTRAASTFFAGVAFSALFLARLPKKGT